MADTNQVTLSWTTTGGDASGLLYIQGPKIWGIYDTDDVGFQPQTSSTTFRVGPGQYTYTLAVKDPQGNVATKSLPVTVGVAVPQITSAMPLPVNPLSPGPATITWTAGTTLTPSTSYRITKPDRTTVDTTATSYVVTATDSAWAGDQLQAWSVAGAPPTLRREQRCAGSRRR